MAEVSFFDPQKDAEVKRRRKMAEMMQQQAQPKDTEVIGGVAVYQSPLEHLARAIQGGMGRYNERKADELEAQQSKARAEMYQKAMGAYGQSPEQAAAILMQDPSLAGDALRMGMSGIDAQRQSASKEAEWQREANLKRELAAMRSGGGMEVDPETGQVSFVQPTSTTSFDTQKVAQAFGVPSQPLDTRGLGGKQAEMFARTQRQKATERLQGKEYEEARDKARTNISDAKRFEQLLTTQGTGGFLAFPGASTVAGWFDPEIREMKSIQDRLTPQQRAPGSGSTSNFDAQMFQNALFGPDKPKQTNENIVTAIKAREQNELDMQSFMSDYLEANGHLNGADKAWQDYLDKNPIFDPNSATPENLVLNKNRKSYKEFFSTQGEAQPSQRDALVQRLKSGGFSQERIDAYLKSKGM